MSGHLQTLHMVILMQQDLQAAIDFYTKLGLKLVFHIKDKWAELNLGNIKIGLCPTNQLMDGNRTGVVLQVDDLKTFYDEHKKTVSFINAPKEAIHGVMVTFKDPGGNLVDLYQPTPGKVTDLIKKVAQEDGQDDSSCKEKVCCKTTQQGVACS